MYHGIINIYKEKGYTSHDVVAKLRGILHIKKIGHTGTLDPDAQGVLPVCLGTATRICEILTDKDKVYEAVLLLGKETDTQDSSGTVIGEYPVTVSEEQVLDVIQHFQGDYWQVPPMYSALKVNGKKLYELAREGKVVERKARLVKIYEITVLELELPRVRIRVRCSKGTYIRTLCSDIGEQLGCKGCMEELLRTRVSCFGIEEAITLAQVETLVREGRINEWILAVDRVLGEYPSITVRKECSRLLYNGNPLLPENLEQTDGEGIWQVEWTEQIEQAEMVRVYDWKGEFVAVYRCRRGRFWVVKMFGGASSSALDGGGIAAEGISKPDA